MQQSTYYIINQSVAVGTPLFARAQSTDPANRDTGNYVEFDSVSPINGAISFTNTAASANGSASINALQLIAVPEPAALYLLAPLAMLGAVRRCRVITHRSRNCVSSIMSCLRS